MKLLNQVSHLFLSVGLVGLLIKVPYWVNFAVVFIALVGIFITDKMK